MFADASRSWWRAPGFALLIAELRQLLRDPRTVFAALVLPTLVVPALFWIQSWSLEQAEERLEARVARYAVAGPETELARALLAAGTERLEQRASNEEVSGVDASMPRLEEAQDVTALGDALAALDDAALDVVLNALPAGTPGLEDDDIDSALEVPLLRIVYRGDDEASSSAASAVRIRLEAGRAARRVAALEAVGLDLPLTDIVAVGERHDLATVAERSGALYGRGAVLVVVFFLFVGGSVVAADTLAGEKERGTLESLLTSGLERRQLVLAKVALVTLVGLFIALVQVLNLWLYVGLRLVDLGDDFALRLTPGAALWLLVLLVPLAVLIAAVLLWISGRSTGTKDFQLRFFPAFLITLAFAAAGFLTALPLRSALVLVPVANVAVGVRELLAGRIDALALAATAVVSSVAAAFAVRATLRDLGDERLVTGAARDHADHAGGAALFPRHVLRWYAGFWVVVFLGSTMAPFASFGGQVALNLVLVFLGGPLLILRLYRLDVRQTLFWRPPRAAVWPAVALGAPAMVVAMSALTEWLGRLLPMPDAMIEMFTRSLLPDDLALWQILLAIAVLPAISEEIAFRGVLLDGLRRRHGAFVACVGSAVVFALVHVSLFRLVPTFLLGVLFAAITLRTRSLWPAMAWHLLNNGLFVMLARSGFEPTVSVAGAVVAWLVAAACVAWIWRSTSRRSVQDAQASPDRISR
ncbi:MAG: CPBP family glutamic-type intramembrane protease [Acidobacteriota bacterium]